MRRGGKSVEDGTSQQSANGSPTAGSASSSTVTGVQRNGSSSYAASMNGPSTSVPTELESWQWKAIEAGDHLLLDKYETTDYNYDQPSQTHATPLITCMDKFIFKAGANDKDKYLSCFRWLMKRGANPLQKAPSNCSLQISYQKRDDSNDKTQRVFVSNKNAIQVAYEIRDSLPSSQTWQEERARVRQVIQIFCEQQAPVESMDKVSISERQISLWERVMNDSSTADLEIRFRDNKSIKAHTPVLCNASDMFRAMFAHNMIEKETKHVDLKGEDADEFGELIHLIYTGFWKSAPTLELILTIYNLADTYQVTDVLASLMLRIKQQLNKDTFEKIFQFALGQGSDNFQNLRVVCCAFAMGSADVKSRYQSGSFSDEVMSQLRVLFCGVDLGASEQAAAASQPSRKRQRISM